MAKIISIHSFRGGTGKSNITANMAALLADRGMRVAVIDTDIQSPGVHVIFRFNESDMVHTLNDYLWGKCEISQSAYDVTSNMGKDLKGKVFLVPSSINPGDIARVLHDGYDVTQLNEGFERLAGELSLDAILVDTHPGLNEETLFSISVSDILLIIMRPDQQDYQGTAVTLKIAAKLDVSRLMMVINKVPAALDQADLERKVAETYDCEVAGVIPHSDEMMLLASSGIFALRYPEHRISMVLSKIVDKLMLPGE